MGIYDGLTLSETASLRDIIESKVKSRIYYEKAHIDNNIQIWLAVYAEYLNKANKEIHLTSAKYYYRQAELDSFFPTSQTNTSNIAMPFSYASIANRHEIMFIDTSTGAKIYEYATKLCEANVGYKDLKGLSVALTQNKTHKVKVVKGSDNIVFILTNDISNALVKQALAIFPALFEIDELLENKEIMNYCKDVINDKPIKEYFKTLFKGIENIKLQKQINDLSNIFNRRNTKLIEDANRDLNSIKERIETYTNYLDQFYEKLDTQQALILGLESKEKVPKEQVKEFLDYINKNRLITDFNLKNNAKIQLIIQAPISIYDPEPLERQIKNRLDAEPGSRIDYILKAFRRIFIEEELTMICQTVVTINLENANLNAYYYDNDKSIEDYAKLPQPHLTMYNCWGDNSNNIKNAIRECDMIEAINRILIATQNINFTDSTVLTNFLGKIRDYNKIYNCKSCLSKADGNLWSIKDIVEQIQREENAQNQTSQTEEKEEIGKPELEEIGRPELEDNMPF